MPDTFSILRASRLAPGWTAGILAAVGAACLAWWALLVPPGDLRPGDRAPAFELAGSDGRTYRLSDYTGRQAVVLAWFPRAFTGL
jgi:peroxiredoxin Q/BCP